MQAAPWAGAQAGDGTAGALGVNEMSRLLDMMNVPVLVTGSEDEELNSVVAAMEQNQPGSGASPDSAEPIETEQMVTICKAPSTRILYTE